MKKANGLCTYCKLKFYNNENMIKISCKVQFNKFNERSKFKEKQKSQKTMKRTVSDLTNRLQVQIL